MSLKALLLGLVFALLWSSAYTAARIIVTYSPPLGALSLRFFISGILALFIAKWLGQNFKLSKKQFLAGKLVLQSSSAPNMIIPTLNLSRDNPHLSRKRGY